jgi:hypothetical protein
MPNKNSVIEKYLTNGRYDPFKSMKIAQTYKEQNTSKGVGVNLKKSDNRIIHFIFSK